MASPRRPSTRWRASIRLGDPIAANGLELVQGRSPELRRPPRKVFWDVVVPPVNVQWPNATCEPAVVGGSACHRTVDVEKPREYQGRWRGTTETLPGTSDAICLRARKGPSNLDEAFVEFEFYEDERGWIAVQFVRQGSDGLVHHVCTHDHDGEWEDTWITTVDTGSWQKACVRLVKPEFTGKGPFGSDVRFVSSGPIRLRSVTLSTERPKDFAKLDIMAHAARAAELLTPRYPEPAGPVSFGNIGTGFENKRTITGLDVTPWLPIYRAMRFTSVQSYVMWRFIEENPGEWDWSLYDWAVKRAKQFGLKWVAFIPIGPWYTLPYWFIGSDEECRNRCLEHGEESWVQSIWSPSILKHVERFFTEFSRHFDHDDVESIMLGPAGDYGETTTNGTFIGKNYHTHVGYWCGEDLAVRDFRRAMKKRYGSAKRLNEAWRSNARSLDDVTPVLREAATDRQWLDQTAWYVDRMTWFTEKWAEIVRKALPETVVYIAAGGAGDPPHAAHWTDQLRMLKKTGIGARVTNEGADYAFNFAYTSWAGTCCRFYGTPFGNEPWGGDMCSTGVLGRIFNGVTYGARNLWFYEQHVHSPAAHAAIERALPLLDGSIKRVNRVAVYYPWTHFVLRDEFGFGDRGRRDIFWPQVEELRDAIDFDLVDDGLIRDGIMREYDFLIVLQGTVYEREELERLVNWVESGGVLVTHNIGTPTTVEGDDVAGRRLFTFEGAVSPFAKRVGCRVARPGNGCVAMYPHRADRRGWHGDPRWPTDHLDHPATDPGFHRFVCGVLANASSFGTGLPDYPVADGAVDEVFGALVERNGKPGALFFSQTEKPVTKHIVMPGRTPFEVTVPPGELHFVALSK